VQRARRAWTARHGDEFAARRDEARARGVCTSGDRACCVLRFATAGSSVARKGAGLRAGQRGVRGRDESAAQVPWPRRRAAGRVRRGGRERMGKEREGGASSPRRRETGTLHGDGGAPVGGSARRRARPRQSSGGRGLRRDRERFVFLGKMHSGRPGVWGRLTAAAAGAPCAVACAQRAGWATAQSWRAGPVEQRQRVLNARLRVRASGRAAAGPREGERARWRLGRGRSWAMIKGGEAGGLRWAAGNGWAGVGWRGRGGMGQPRGGVQLGFLPFLFYFSSI
jgi:hypothetical protein